MKTLKFLLAFLILFTYGDANAQFFKKLKQRAEEAAKETIFQKSEEEASKRSGQAMDSIFDQPDKIGKKKGNRKNKNDEGNDQMPMDEGMTMGGTDDVEASDEMTINRNFDFVPGNKTLFHDDFAPDQLGDFPSKWDTNGSGELVDIEGEKWMSLTNKSTYLPLVSNELPTNYSIEFDLYSTGVDHRTSSNPQIDLIISDNDSFEKGKTWSAVQLTTCQFIASPGYLMKYENGERILWNQVGKDYREAINGKSRISILANEKRLRVWLNERKIVDVPRLLGDGLTNFKIEISNLIDKDQKEQLFIKDFRIAETVADNRSKLLTEGSLSTNSILFDSGSANLQNVDSAVINEIGTVLVENPEVAIKIVGHTDSDGDDESNLELSMARANAVKQTIINKYGIDATRILTEGMGETQPLADNSTVDGKAQNRRVEFIKL